MGAPPVQLPGTYPQLPALNHNWCEQDENKLNFYNSLTRQRNHSRVNARQAKTCNNLKSASLSFRRVKAAGVLGAWSDAPTSTTMDCREVEALALSSSLQRDPT